MTEHEAATSQVCPVLGPLASRYRRELGPTAWVVLEAVFELSSETDGGTVSQTSVRVLADELGLAKDTVARALRLLADRHLIAFDTGPRRAGRFGAGRYVLTLPFEVLRHSIEPLPNSCTAVRQQSQKSTHRFTFGEQLTLEVDP